MALIPAWSNSFASDTIPSIQEISLLDSITWDKAFGDSTGKKVKVAVIDSGIDAMHPAINGLVNGYVSIEAGKDGFTYNTEPHDDAFGHGTACAAIIRALAPDCELYSVKVLGKGLIGRGEVFIAGLRWAVDHGMDICNLSLGTTKKEFSVALHEIVDTAYFRHVILVSAANNLPIPSFPSMYASVISVACHMENDKEHFYYNPTPPVEFGAPGIDQRVAWLNQGWITATGNSFATPHITGIVTKILGKYPNLTPFQVKTILKALASNTARDVLMNI